jgi:HD-GYP domain-containing protein (c-di-GMP phosphodiesterase class II)
MTVKQIPSDKVELGMYISRLDRPWIETPFIFQGFVVKEQWEIDELKRFTKYVYISAPDEEIELKKYKGKLPESDQKTNIKNTIYKNTISADDEIEQIRTSHANFARSILEIEGLVIAEGIVKIEHIEEPIKTMVNSVTKNPDAYIWLTRLKKFDSFIYKDSLMKAVLGAALGRKLGLPENELQILASGCLLMDIGKLLLPTGLLHKAGELNKSDWKWMKKHVQYGIDILERSSNISSAIIDIVRTHHERLDGSGYMDGLQGSEIPYYGQIAGIVDTYVAVTNPRPYATPLSHSKAQSMLYNQKSHQFDEMLVEYFILTLSAYPTGTLVELSTGEVGIVKSQKGGARLRPDVILLLNPKKEPYGSFTIANLDDYTVNDELVTIARSLPDGCYGLEIEELSF